MYGNKEYAWLVRQLKKYIKPILIGLIFIVVIFSISILITLGFTIFFSIKGFDLSSNSRFNDLDLLFKLGSYLIAVLSFSSVIFTAFKYIQDQRSNLSERKLEN